MPTTGLGPLISHEHRNKVLSYYKKAVEEGARVVTGGGVPDMPGELDGRLMDSADDLDRLAGDGRRVTEEIFGPCCHVSPFDSEDEVIARANATGYGLAASVWTTNLTRAHRVAGRIEAGLVWVNSWFLRDLRTPFGGMKNSGHRP